MVSLRVSSSGGRKVEYLLSFEQHATHGCALIFHSHINRKCGLGGGVLEEVRACTQYAGRRWISAIVCACAFLF